MLRKRANDFCNLFSCLDSFADKQATVTSYDTDTLDWLVVEIVPSDGLYRGACVKFKVSE